MFQYLQLNENCTSIRTRPRRFTVGVLLSALTRTGGILRGVVRLRFLVHHGLLTELVDVVDVLVDLLLNFPKVRSALIVELLDAHLLVGQRIGDRSMVARLMMVGLLHFDVQVVHRSSTRVLHAPEQSRRSVFVRVRAVGEEIVRRAIEKVVEIAEGIDLQRTNAETCVDQGEFDGIVREIAVDSRGDIHCFQFGDVNTV